jgi:hypothetical protein
MRAARCFFDREALRNVIIDFVLQMGVEFLRQFSVLMAAV